MELDRRELDDPEVIDVFSFRALERLRVHETRTLAELDSQVIRGSVRRQFRNLLVVRGE